MSGMSWDERYAEADFAYGTQRQEWLWLKSYQGKNRTNLTSLDPKHLPGDEPAGSLPAFSFAWNTGRIFWHIKTICYDRIQYIRFQR